MSGQVGSGKVMSGQDRIGLVKVMSGRVGSSEKKPGKVLLDKIGYLQ
jgi:hypothetical protein